MDRMKTFALYALLIVAFGIFSNIMLWVYTQNAYKPIDNYQVLCDVPQVNITKAEANYACGRVSGTITNTATENLAGRYIKISVYSTHGVCLGNKYISLDSIAPGKTKDFFIQYQYENSAYIAIDLADSTEEIREEDTQSDPSPGLLACVAILILSLIP